MSMEPESVNQESQSESFVDSILGGEETSHSPNEENHEFLDETQSSNADDGDAAIPETDEEDSFADDSLAVDRQNPETPHQEQGEAGGTETPIPDAEAVRLKQEVATLTKRLHDTQSAMHRATGERAALAKKLSDLQAKKDNDDDWFSESDREQAAQLTADLKKSDAEIGQFDAQAKEIERKAAEVMWDQAAAPVIAQHPDFEHVVYEVFAELLDPQKGNAQVRAAWDKERDKGPANAYRFAGKIIEALEMQRDPDAYKAKLRKEIEAETKANGNTASSGVPLGKAGLDMIPSATGPAENGTDGANVSFVDALFRE